MFTGKHNHSSTIYYLSTWIPFCQSKAFASKHLNDKTTKNQYTSSRNIQCMHCFSDSKKKSQVKLMNDDENKQELAYLKSKYSVHALFLTYLENLTSRNHDDKDHQK